MALVHLSHNFNSLVNEVLMELRKITDIFPLFKLVTTSSRVMEEEKGIGELRTVTTENSHKR